jgi:hypothetical protein
VTHAERKRGCKQEAVLPFHIGELTAHKTCIITIQRKDSTPWQHFQSPLLTAIIRRCFELLSTWVEHRLSHRIAKYRHPYASFVLIGSHTSIAGYLHPHIRQHVFVASLLATYSVSAYVDVEMPENLLEQWPERAICVSLILLWFRNFRGRETSTASLATYRSYRMLLDQVLVQVENLFANLEVEFTGSFH